MDPSKYRIEVITTYERAEEAVRLYADTANKFNPFIAALKVDPKSLYEETVKPKIKTIADQALSVGMYNNATNDLMCATIAVDMATEFNIELKSKILKARAALFQEGKDKVLNGNKIKLGDAVEIMFAVTKPEYMNMNLFKFVDEFLNKHHIERGYEMRYAEITVPITQYLFQLLEVPYTCVRVFYDNFEFEGEKVFKSLKFGKGYQNERPCVMFYYIKNTDYFEASAKWIEKARSSKSKL